MTAERWWTAVIMAATLAGAQAETVRTVSEWVARPQERAALLTICRNNPGQLRQDVNCQNAEKAAALVELVRRGGGGALPKPDFGQQPWRWDEPGNPAPGGRP